MTDTLHVLVNRGDISQVRIEQTPTLEPSMGDILVRVNRVALTANNVTYAVVADRIPYFEFFPAPPGWGRLPVWGFGDVLASNCPGIEPRERLYGFWPTSTHVVLTPGNVSRRSFVDAAEHRAPLPPIYNSYSRVATDPTYTEHEEPQIAIFRPLFLTSFTLDWFLVDHAFFGAQTVLISSASSKTAWSLAHLLRARDVRTVGLTSSHNRDFVASLDSYDTVATYDGIDELEVRPSTYVDFAGSVSLRTSLRERLGSNLVYDCAVGVAHWQDQAPADPWDGPEPVLFFAPSQFARLLAEHGAEPFWTAYATGWRGFLDATSGRLRLLELNGVDALASGYQAFVRGEINPATGVVVRF